MDDAESIKTRIAALPAPTEINGIDVDFGLDSTDDPAVWIEGSKTMRPAMIRNHVRRADEHRTRKNVCRSWARGTKSSLPASTAALTTDPVQPGLGEVAKAFVLLQEARHAADYDLSQPLTRPDSAALVACSEKAFRDWDAVRATPNASVFLAALLFEKQWKGR
jgi:hypothetical protein